VANDISTGDQLRLGKLLDGFRAPAAGLAPGGRILLANRPFHEMLAGEAGRLEGTPLEQHVAPEDRLRFVRLLDQAVTLRGVRADVALRRQDGGVVHAQLSLRSLPGRDIVLVVAVDLAQRHPASAGDLEAAAQRGTPTRAGRGPVQDEPRDGRSREQAEEALRDSERRLHGIVHSAMDAILSVDADQRIILFNPAAEQMFRCPAHEAIGRPLERFIPKRVQAAHRRHVEEFGRHGVTSRKMGALGELTALRADGEEFPIEASISKMDVGGKRVYTVILRDIGERKRAEDALRQALADKETLLREVHHRTKNNLQMLCDVLYLESESLPDGQGKSALHDAYTRIFAIARLHEQLYLSMGGGQVRLTEYLRRLVAGFQALYPDVPVRLEASVGALLLDLDRAVHTGLIVNELVSNTMKHAFPDGRRGEVQVRLAQVGDDLELQVRDNGTGLPTGMELKAARSLGLRIVHILAQRLRARVTVASDGGAVFTIAFPLQAELPVEPTQQ
jgi:PAS domain S-box-containing protein